MRLLWTIVQSEADIFSVGSDPGPIPQSLLFFSCHKLRYALISRAVVLGAVSVLLILSMARLSKVYPPVVSGNCVFMIHLLLRPSPGHVEPCKAVGVIKSPTYADSSVSPFVHSASGHSAYCRRVHKHTPSEYPRFGIVSKESFQFFSRQHHTLGGVAVGAC